jgi:acid stress-induced BolA-like protein IbaG/YrbA
VSGLFDGKRAIQRQQMIYAVLEEFISSGVIHAINMNLFSEEEWRLQG